MIAAVVLGLLQAAAAAASGQFRLTVLHTNDLHSHYDETCRDGRPGSPCGAAGGYGGFARLRAALDAERVRAVADGEPAGVVHLNAGDTFKGTRFYDVLGWQAAADLIGNLGVDAMCLGNHEFEDGPEALAPFLKSKNISSIPIVVANIHTEEEPSLTNIQPSTVLTVGGHTVGVIGYLTPNTEFMNKVGKVRITDELQSVRTEVAKLKNAGVEFIIALGHSGLEIDRQVAREVDGVDAVVGGHSHSYLYSGPPQDTETPVGPYPVIEKRGEQIVPVVQAYALCKYLGKLVLTFNSEKRLVSAVGAPIFLDQTVPQDPKMLEKVEYYKQVMGEPPTDIAIGKTQVFLDGNCKCAETNLANLITDSFIRINLKNLLKNNVTLRGWTDAAVAITLSSSIQSSIDASKSQGNIYEADIQRTLPYKTSLCKVTITGATLLKALEHSASMYDYANCSVPEKNIYGGFMQMSGMHVTYDIKNAVGSRVQSVKIQCSECKLPSYEPIDLEKKYTIIMTKYMAYGGDQYKMIKDELISINILEFLETDALLSYVKEITPIYAEVNNRVKVLNCK
ncbi:protein 5NUC-like [Rhopalosiphum maidis]|uniref:protein 5NUC-like n=1 Tax=Rhopalosiphum maidis TaxID=43146 RepID=UPI000EFE0AE9|nr:protein 5NUC-like [Rhopalosiphum maidis]